MLQENIHKNAPIARAADWVGALGEHVFLLYGHPKCLWEYTFWSRQNVVNMSPHTKENLKNHGIYTLQAN
eukprot:4874432-Prorocentrum_lima.AAC.1